MLEIHSLQGSRDIQMVQSWLTRVIWSEKGYLGHFQPPGKPVALQAYTADLDSPILDLAKT